MRRRGWVCVLVLAGALGSAGDAVQSSPPDLVLVNGTVRTVDRTFSTAEAVAVTGSRITAVGTSAAVRALAGPATRLIDLDGSTLVPGLMDNHLHGAGGGPGVDLSRARSLAGVFTAIAGRVRETRPAASSSPTATGTRRS